MIRLGLQSEVTPDGAANIPGTDAESLRQLSHQLALGLGERFEVLGPMAIGGMAVLFRIRHRMHGGLLAAKVMHRHFEQRAEVVASFQREALHLGRLADHPNLIPIFDSQFDDGFAFHLYPFIEGEDLDHLIARTPLHRDEALHMAAQMSSVLCHLESHGIVHGDISPGNIRVDTFGRYRLLDFGLSRDVSKGVPWPQGGTPRYMSPEQIEGAPADHQSDLYALGLVLCEAVTGRPLIEGESFNAIEQCHREGRWSLPEIVRQDVPFAHLLQCLLARKPSERMVSAFVLSGALAALGFERPEFQRPRHKATSARRNRLMPLQEDAAANDSAPEQDRTTS